MLSQCIMSIASWWPKPCLTLHPWNSRTRHPASCPVAFCRCRTVHQGRLATVFLFLLLLQDRASFSHLVEFLFLGLWWCHQEMPVVKDHYKATKESTSCARSVICRPVWLQSSPVNSSWVWVPAPRSTTPWMNIWSLPDCTLSKEAMATGCTLSREAMVIAQDVMRRVGVHWERPAPSITEEDCQNDASAKAHHYSITEHVRSF